MTSIVAVRPNIILGQQYLFSSQIEPSVFIFWQNMTYCSKKYPLSVTFNLHLERYLQKNEQVEQFLIEITTYRREAPTGGW
jgi:hypothetical protein